MLIRLNKAARALSDKRKVIIYGTDTIAQEAYKFLQSRHIPVLYFIDDSPSLHEIDTVPVRNKYDLLLENTDDIFILSCVDCEDYRTDILSFFFQLGLFFRKDFLNIYGSGEEFLKGRSDKMAVFDTDLGLSRIDDIPGFKIFGNKDNKDAKIIVTLGGSTTDPRFNNFVSWTEYLYRKLSSVDKNIVIYCGGISGYDVKQELIKLIRDVLPLSPYAVISYSGVNDFQMGVSNPLHGRYKHPFVSEQKYYFYKMACQNYLDNALFLTGLQNNKTRVENWIDYESIMHCIAKEFSFYFIGILQPAFHSGSSMARDGFKYYADEYVNEIRVDCEGYSFPLEEYKKSYNEAQSKIKRHRFILDYTNIFDGLDSPFYDAWHVSSIGNNIIANHIVEDLIKQKIIPAAQVSKVARCIEEDVK
jgi:hypothetical protein